MSKIFWANSYIYRSNREKTGKEGYKSMQSTVLHSPASMSRRSSSWHRFFPRIDAIMNLKWFDRLSDNKLSRSLVVSDLRLETNGSRFETGCYLWAGGSGCEELKKVLPLPLQSCDSWMVVKENQDRKKKSFYHLIVFFVLLPVFFCWRATMTGPVRIVVLLDFSTLFDKEK